MAAIHAPVRRVGVVAVLRMTHVLSNYLTAMPLNLTGMFPTTVAPSKAVLVILHATLTMISTLPETALKLIPNLPACATELIIRTHPTVHGSKAETHNTPVSNVRNCPTLLGLGSRLIASKYADPRVV